MFLPHLPHSLTKCCTTVTPNKISIGMVDTSGLVAEVNHFPNRSEQLRKWS
jgi:hypothetical protein